MKTLEKMKADLRNAEENLKVDLIKNNPKLKKSLEEKVVELKASIKNYVPVKESTKKEAPKEATPKKEAPKKEAPKVEPKKEVAKKEAPKKEVAPKKEAPKKEAPKKEAAPKPKLMGTSGFEVGNKVSFIKKSTGEKIVGTISRIYEYADTPGKFIAVVTDKNGKKHQPTISPALQKQ